MNWVEGKIREVALKHLKANMDTEQTLEGGKKTLLVKVDMPGLLQDVCEELGVEEQTFLYSRVEDEVYRIVLEQAADP